MARFLALYEGPTISSARLLAVSAEPRLISKFFEELVAEPEEDNGGRAEDRGRVLELARGEREE
jgi:hypothetical protein